MPLRFFYSYSHQDEWYRQELGKHLAPLRDAGMIDDWHDRRILPGENWERSIADELDRADVVLLLVSADFLNSRYCQGIELTRALERSQAGETAVVPIILKSCLWQVSKVGQAKLQATPKDALPVNKWEPIDDAFLDVASAIYEMVQERGAAGLGFFPGDEGRAAAAGERLWSVPHPANPFFTGREELLAGIERELGGGRSVVLWGTGGTGKSAIAVEFANRKRRSYRVVWWIRAEHRDSALADFAALAQALELPEAGERDHERVLAAVHRWLGANDRWLLLLDNVSDQKSLAPLLPPAGAGHLIATSRASRWPPRLAALEVNAWSRKHSITYLLARTGEDDRQAADAVADLHGDLPLALEQAAAFLEQERAKAA